MSTFNDLVADLTRENLLDDSGLILSPKANNESKSQLDSDLPGPPFPDLITIAENYELKLPEFSVLKPENEIAFEEGQLINVFPANDSSLTFQNTQNLFKHQTHRQRTKRSLKTKRFCSSCGTTSLKCRHGHQKVGSDLYYYSLILSGLIIFIWVIWSLINIKL